TDPHHRTPRPAGLVPELPCHASRPYPTTDPRRRPGRPALDDPGGLPERRVPLLVLYDPQVPPRCCRRAPEPRLAGPAVRPGESRPPPGLRRVARVTARAGAPQRR